MFVEHGGNMIALAETMGYSASDCIDFSANINPIGLSPLLKEHIIQSLDTLTQYPDIYYQKAREAIAHQHQEKVENILLANGAVEIFYQIAQYFQPKALLTLSPTFMEYEKAFSQVGTIINHCVLPPPNYTWSVEQLLDASKALSSGDIVLICNPNNPTGTLTSVEALKTVAYNLSLRGILLVIDEAFIDFLTPEVAYSFISELKYYPNTIVVRSLTKFYAIPGLRIGYAVSHHPNALISIMHSNPPWTVNALAQSAIPILFSDSDYIHQTQLWLKKEQSFLYNALVSFPSLTVVKPTVNYIFFEYTGNLDLQKELWKQKLFIRSCKNYSHLSDKSYRIGIRTRKENQRLIQALEQLLE